MSLFQGRRVQPLDQAPGVHVVAISASNLTFTFPDGSVALSDVSVSVPSGSRLGIVGLNGSGKTTLLHLLAGLRSPTAGRIRLEEGRPLEIGPGRRSRADRLRWRRRVGLVMDSPETMLFGGTVEADIAFGPTNLGADPEEVEARVERELHRFDLGSLRAHPIHALSRGQLRRVAMAGVLAMNPEVLLFDEPLMGLDSSGRRDFVQLLDALSSQGRTVVFASHDPDFLAEEATSLLVLHEGTLLAEGSPSKVLGDGSVLARTGLAAPMVSRLFHRLVKGGLIPPTDLPPPVTLDDLAVQLRGRVTP